jgi:hypothetical protein
MPPFGRKRAFLKKSQKEKTMDKIAKAAESARESKKIEDKGGHANFMGGISYTPDPLTKLKLIAASSIFGEPAYYRDGINEKAYVLDECFAPFVVFDVPSEKTSDLMLKAIDEALAFDFGKTIALAATLREDFLMRLNPQIIMVKAAMHPARKAFDEANPGVFSAIEKRVMARADEPASQLAAYVYLNKGSKSKLPNILKKSWARKIESLKPYEMAKYKSEGVGMIDVVRLCHASSPLVDELMKTGTVKTAEDEKTWENLLSAGKNWSEILSSIKVGHMALLRNLRNIMADPSVSDAQRDAALSDLVKGVPFGKQFPFRYKNAYDAISAMPDFPYKEKTLKAIDDCLESSVGNLPRLHGRVAVLTDNSGSAWGAFESEYGRARIADIDNLSAVCTALAADEGWVGVFGDRLKMVCVKPNGQAGSKPARVMDNVANVTSEGRGIGGSTENGIWLFLSKAIKEKQHWDWIFIYSDMQAGHGGLYGTNPSEYRAYSTRGTYIDVAKLVDAYRRTVNPKVNVVSVQTAGYDDVVVPEYGYRTEILTGWTGKEAVFADAVAKVWDEEDAKMAAKKEKAEAVKAENADPKKKEGASAE